MRPWVVCQDGSAISLDQYAGLFIRKTPPAPGSPLNGGARLELAAVSSAGIPWVVAVGSRENLEELLRALLGLISKVEPVIGVGQIVEGLSAMPTTEEPQPARVPCPACSAPVARGQTGCFGCGAGLTPLPVEPGDPGDIAT